MIIGEYPIGSPPGIGDSYISQSISYYIDEISTFTGVEVIEGGFRYSMNRLAGIYLLRSLESAYEAITSIGKLDVPSVYSMTTGILNPIIYYSFDCSIRPSYDSTIPSTSVIDALVWTYADMFDAIWRQMETMANALKLEYALGSDLDDAWGQIYDLPRIVNENDTSYRDRLKTRTTILNGSGTKSNCEIIINSIIGSESTTLTTRYPASVDITFSTEDAIRVAIEKASTLAILLPQMLAHGVTYNLFLPLLDYYITTLMKGTNDIYYDSRFAIGYFDVETLYGMQNALFYQYEFNYDMKVLTKKAKNKTYRTDLLSKKKDKNFTYLMDSLVRNTEYTTSNLFITMRKNGVLHPFIIDQYVLKYNIEKQYFSDSVAVKSVPRRYEFSLVLV